MQTFKKDDDDDDDDDIYTHDEGSRYSLTMFERRLIDEYHQTMHGSAVGLLLHGSAVGLLYMGLQSAFYNMVLVDFLGGGLKKHGILAH